MQAQRMWILIVSLLTAACAAPGTPPAPTTVPASAPSTSVPPTAVQTMAPPAATIAPSPTAQPEPTAARAQAGSEFNLALAPIIEGGLVRPDYLTHAGDDRLFVVEQPGRIRIIQNGQLLDQPFLDITDKVTTNGNEQGLLSVAFHPDYKS